MKQKYCIKIFSFVALMFFLFSWNALAGDKVVVVTLGGTVGNATAADVVKGKSFSSKAAGKGKIGTLEIRTGGTIYTNTIGMKFSLIPAGSFVMGSPDGSGDADHPPIQLAEPGRGTGEKQHQVTLTRTFYMQTTEVTQGQWETVMGAGTNPSNFDTCGMNCPVEGVSWNDTQNFIAVLNALEHRTGCNTIPNTCYSLPTEAQWEYAARAGTVTAFYNGKITNPVGNDANLDQIGWYGGNSGFITHPVAQKKPNNWGLYDMLGNVEEWCEDFWENYPAEPVTDPSNSFSGSSHIVRGGNAVYSYEPSDCRSARRASWTPNSTGVDLGFRLVLHTVP